MAFWLLKTEPGSYSWQDLVRDGRTQWDGVRNHAAAAHLRAMVPGDRALIYHSGEERAAVGIAEVVDGPTDDGADGRWVSVAIAPASPLARPVTLKAMKDTPALAGMAMLRQSRLSVSPVTDAEWSEIERLSRGG